ncbi:peptidoglycan-binding protein [Kiloniella antarctica]|uniref:Peptidoglycan-binding protein n=1 Tax=Kiloniella antarctica TaxID=1550907 RepID=A0ABW5BHZ7_9PROT
MKLIQQLLYAGIISCSMVFGSFAYSASFDEAMEAFENRDYTSAYQDFSSIAQTGDRDAQFMLGYVYSKGYGTPQDYVEAHKWFNLASSQGDREARRARDSLTKFMSAQQISRAQQLATEWKPLQTQSIEKNEQKEQHTSEPVILWSDPEPTLSPSALENETTELSRTEKRELQKRLRDAGYDPGPIDGLPGERTLRAIRSYQSDFGIDVDGLVSREILSDLRSRNFADGKTAESMEIKREDVLLTQLRELDKDGQNAPLSGTQYKQRVSAILADYDRPWLTRVLYDNFRDGDYTLNPRWVVESGSFSVGNRDYLYTSVPVPRIKPSNKKKSDTEEIVGIFSDIFAKATQEDEEQDDYTGYAEIYNASPISNSFSARVNVNGLLANGRLIFGVYQGTSRINGYKVAYNTGSNSSIQLLRTSFDGQSVIGSMALSQELTGEIHNVELRRNGEGVIEVVLDDNILFTVTDTKLTGEFDGFVMGNHGGDFRIIELEVYSER